MHALQLLKFAQHSDLRKELLATGLSKLIYAQPSSSKVKDGDDGKDAGSGIPDFLLFYLRSLNSPNAAQNMGRLLHADDIWWGTDTALDPQASMGNKLYVSLLACSNKADVVTQRGHPDGSAYTLRSRGRQDSRSYAWAVHAG